MVFVYIFSMDIIRKQDKGKKTIVRLLILTAVLSGLVAGGYAISKMENALPVVRRELLMTGKVVRSDMRIEIKGVGTLVSEDMLVVPSLVSGRIDKILVQPGVEVSPETVIVKLSNPELELELLNAESDLNSANARFIAAKAEMTDKLMGMKASYAQAKANYQAAKLRNEVETQQYEDGLISKLQYTLSTDSVKNQKELLDIQAKRLEIFEEQTRPAQLAVSEATVKQAESMCKLRKSQFESLNVRAGVSGVLAPIKDKIEPGIKINPGQILARITNPENLKAQLMIPQGQAKDVKVGQQVEINTFNGTINGVIACIEPSVVDGKVMVDVDLDGSLPKGARPDLSVVGTIIIDHLTDIVHVDKPITAVAGSESCIYKLSSDGTSAEKVQVSFGHSAINDIEVKVGLEVGDVIILSDISQYSDAEKIKIE